jgi:hypothetical protein
MARLNFTFSAYPQRAESRPAAATKRCRAHLFPRKEHRAARLPVGFNVTVPRRVSSSAVSRIGSFCLREHFRIHPNVSEGVG